MEYYFTSPDDEDRILGRPTDEEPWVCNLCGSAHIQVYYTERRVAPVTTLPANALGWPCPAAWPKRSEGRFAYCLLDFDFDCLDCDERTIDPVLLSAYNATKEGRR